MTQRGEVPGGERAAGDVVVEDRVVVGARQAAAGKHDRDPGLVQPPQDLAPVEMDGGGDHRVDPAADQVVEQQFEALPVVPVSATRGTNSSASSTREMPRITPVLNGLSKLEITTPTDCVIPRFRPAASRSREYPSSAAALLTRSAVSVPIRHSPAESSAREAVDTWTPASAATSRSVTFRRARPSPRPLKTPLATGNAYLV